MIPKKLEFPSGASLTFEGNESKEGINIDQLSEIKGWTTLDKLFPTFNITLDEARALNFLLKLHSSLLKEHPDEYGQLLRLINGLSQFIDGQK